MTYFALFTFFVCSLIFFACLNRRAAVDVLKDLKEQERYKKKNHISANFYFINQAKKELNFLKILSEYELKKEDQKIILSILSGAIVVLLLSMFFRHGNNALLSVIAGSCLGYVAALSKLRSREDKFKQQVIFYLPVVMERVVMAVQSGLDIVPALKAIEQIEHKIQAENGPDVVTLLLRRIVNLTEAGISFEAAVNDVTSMIDIHALRHALIHLTVAHKEGGELIYPLRELSDATQIYFQESVEEDIARMPIKATLPLLLTFAGLIITFMTGPLIQIMNVSANPTFISENKTKSNR